MLVAGSGAEAGPVGGNTRSEGNTGSGGVRDRLSQARLRASRLALWCERLLTVDKFPSGVACGALPPTSRGLLCRISAPAAHTANAQNRAAAELRSGGAQKACLERYRSASREIIAVLHKAAPAAVLEKASIDEVYMDVTALVDNELQARARGSRAAPVSRGGCALWLGVWGSLRPRCLRMPGCLTS